MCAVFQVPPHLLTLSRPEPDRPARRSHNGHVAVSHVTHRTAPRGTNRAGADDTRQTTRSRRRGADDEEQTTRREPLHCPPVKGRPHYFVQRQGNRSVLASQVLLLTTGAWNCIHPQSLSPLYVCGIIEILMDRKTPQTSGTVPSRPAARALSCGRAGSRC